MNEIMAGYTRDGYFQPIQRLIVENNMLADIAAVVGIIAGVMAIMAGGYATYRWIKKTYKLERR